jgi:hypothetical protein
LARVNFNPSIASGLQSATRVTLAPATGSLASNVAVVKFDFTSPTSENGYCGYSEITLFGTATPAVPATLTATLLTGLASFILNVSGLSSGQNYAIQSTTNLASTNWFTETNFVAGQAVAVFTNSTANAVQKFYRIVGF